MQQQKIKQSHHILFLCGTKDIWYQPEDNCQDESESWE